MRRGKLLVAWRGPVVVMLLLSLCTAGQAASPPPASAQPDPCVTNCPGLASTFNNDAITADYPPASNTTPNDGLGFDGNKATFSQTALQNAGAAPGALIRSSGVTFTFPNVAANASDNTVVAGQTITMSGSGILGFLVSASNGGAAGVTGAGTITYTDGSTGTYTLTGISDWRSSTAPAGGTVAITASYSNRPTTPYTDSHFVDIFSVTVPLAPGKTVQSVTLPTGAALAPGASVIHVFAIATTVGGILISQGKTATASSIQNDSFPASDAFDGNLTGTRWASVWGVDPQWLQVDLGYVAAIDHVALYWESAYATAFQIQTSMDGSSWTSIYSTTTGTGGTQILSVTGTGRYVRMYGTTRALNGSVTNPPTGYGYSLWEFQVYGNVPAPAPNPDVSVGNSHACAIVVGTTYCWGDNTSGELGTGSTTPSYQTIGLQATAFSPTPSQVTAGNYNTCMLNTTYQAYCLGRNSYGELGTTGSPVLTPTAPVTGAYGQVSASYNGNHTCALDTMNEAYCWGRNNYYQLGNTTAGGPTPVAVTVPTVPSPGTPTFTEISAGTDNTCAVATTGFAYCWGNNTAGKLGCSTTVNPACPSTSTYTSLPVAVDTSGALNNETVTQITAGDTHTCALDSAGNAYCWGSNANGQLGCGTTCGASSNVPVAVSAPPGTKWAQITAGSSFTCALTTDGNAYCWGLGATGQLGNGTTTSSYVPVAVSTGAGTELPAGTVLTQISSGYSSTCAMDTTSHVYCWGLNNNGQLGNGTQVTSDVPVLVIFGLVTIACSGNATLSATTPGGTASGLLGDVTVTDTRPLEGGNWEVSVSATDFTRTAAPAADIPATDVTYTIAPIPPSTSPFTDVDGTEPTNEAPPPLGVTFGEVTTPPPGLPDNAVPVVTGSGTYAVTWDPTVTVKVPPTAVSGTYTATIYYSVVLTSETSRRNSIASWNDIVRPG
jgi:alpha-tubulin suppressor-like RCC1 family protein